MLLTTVKGSSSTGKWEKIKSLPISLPPSGDFDTFLADVMVLESMMAKYRDLVREKEEALRDKFGKLFL
jgi:hypothetical protein